MSQSDSFISEVTEEVRRDKLYDTFRRYRWALVAAVVGIVGAAAWHEIDTFRDRAGAQTRGDALRAALATSDPAARATALQGLDIGQGNVVGRLGAAGAALEAGDVAGAGATLEAVAADPATPELYRSLASLQRVMVLGPTLEPGERLAALDKLAGPGEPFRLLALEQRALLRVEQGDTQAALADLTAIDEASDAPAGLRERARQLTIALGGPAVTDATGDATTGDATTGAAAPGAPAGAASGG